MEMFILRFHEHGCLQPCRPEVPWNFFKGVIIQYQQQSVSKGIVYLFIPIIVRVITI